MVQLQKFYKQCFNNVMTEARIWSLSHPSASVHNTKDMQDSAAKQQGGHVSVSSDDMPRTGTDRLHQGWHCQPSGHLE